MGGGEPAAKRLSSDPQRLLTMAVRLDSLSEAGLNPHSVPSGSAHRVIRDFSRSEGGDVRGSAVVFSLPWTRTHPSPDSFDFLGHNGHLLGKKRDYITGTITWRDPVIVVSFL